MKRMFLLIMVMGCWFLGDAQVSDSSVMKAGRLMEESGARMRKAMALEYVGGAVMGISMLLRSPQYDNGVLIGYDYTGTILVSAIGGVLILVGVVNQFESARLLKNAGWLLQGGKPR